jgi:hypothetical protein
MKYIKATTILVILAAAVTAFAAEEHTWQSLNVGDLKWDHEVNLWASPGHAVKEGEKEKPVVHNSRFASGNLLLAGRFGLLGDPRVEQVLTVMEQMQSEVNGCIKANYYDEAVTDSNFSFFVCRNLLFIESFYDDQLTEGAREKLNKIFENFYGFFYDQTLEDSAYYPNKYAGDLVCVKLLQEMLDRPREEVVTVKRRMMEGARYWKDHQWGWGEHMSNIYGATCADLFSQYLLFSKEKGGRVYGEYQELLNELLHLEDLYDGGPRIPLIRSYSFKSRSTNENFRDGIKKWDPSMARINNNYWRAGALRSALLYEAGWHEKIEPPRAKPAKNIEVPCFGDKKSVSYLLDDIRLGSITEFPVMPEAENLGWGLAWQSFPVCMWRPDGDDWMFLQWQTFEDDQVRAHPAHHRTGPRALSDEVNPPIFGRTYAIQDDGDVLVLRIMPKIVSDWDMVKDSFKLATCTGELSEANVEGSFSQLLIKYPERTVSVSCFPIADRIEAKLEEEDGIKLWSLVYPEDKLSEIRERKMVVDVWGISLNGRIESKPLIEEVGGYMLTPLLDQQTKKRLKWKWPTKSWDVIIDPTSDQPLRIAD